MENYTLKSLPYGLNALEPSISSKTMELHWGKHLATYVNNYNNLKQGTEFADKPLIDAVRHAQGGLFNNAAQIFNHEFFFDELSPNPQKMPNGSLLKAIETTFGSFDKFKEEFNNAAVGQFGSGWAWLCKDGSGKLSIMTTSNADNPLRHDMTPLMTVDVWEHAYYVDYQNRRAEFLTSFWNVLNWKVVEERFAKA